MSGRAGLLYRVRHATSGQYVRKGGGLGGKRAARIFTAKLGRLLVAYAGGALELEPLTEGRHAAPNGVRSVSRDMIPGCLQDLPTAYLVGVCRVSVPPALATSRRALVLLLCLSELYRRRGRPEYLPGGRANPFGPYRNI